MANDKKKVSASSVANDLHKMAKLYEVFKNASDAANLLASIESTEKKLKSNVESLKKEQITLDAECESLNSYCAVAEDKLKELNVKAQVVESEYNHLVRTITQKADAEAAKIIEGAERVLVEINDRVEDALDFEKSVKDAIQTAEQELSDVNQRIELIKTNALKALA